MSSPSTPSTPLALRSALQSRLASLPFPAFVEIGGRLLTILGYEDVRAVQRSGKKGKNRSGGFDLGGWVKGGATRRRIVAQVKQITPDAKVHQRSLDEVRGAALRIGATEALILTTGGYSYIVQEQMERQQRASSAGAGPLVPVQCLDGGQIADLLLTHKLGVKASGNSLQIDEAFFIALAAQAAQAARQAYRARPASTHLGKVPASIEKAPPKGKRTRPDMRPVGPSAQLSLHFWLPLPGPRAGDR